MVTTWSVSRVRSQPTLGGGVALDLTVAPSPASEAWVVRLALSSRVVDELREVLREMVGRG
jgi:hypothetical protein